MFGNEEISIQKPEIPEGEAWSNLKTLNLEKEYVGIYLSSHPLEEYRIVLDNFCKTPISALSDLEELHKQNKDFVIGGMITSVNILTNKKDQDYARFVIEDQSGSYEFFLFLRRFVMNFYKITKITDNRK